MPQLQLQPKTSPPHRLSQPGEGRASLAVCLRLPAGGTKKLRNLPSLTLPQILLSQASAEEAKSAEENKREAIVRFLSGQEFYERGVQLGDTEGAQMFTKALTEFKKADTLYPTPDLQYNIARTLEHLGELGPAVNAYQNYLNDSPDVAASKKDREEAARHIDKILLEHKDIPPPTRPVDKPAHLVVPVQNDAVLAPEIVPAPVPEKKPIYKRAVFWGPIAGVVVAGVVVGVLLGVLPNDASAPSGSDAGFTAFSF